MAPLLSSIRADIGVNNAVMGLILGAWPMAYILCAIPCGLLLDWLGPRRLLAIATVVMAASAFARCGAETPLQLFFAVALFGVGGPMISVGAPVIIAKLYQGKARATAMGLYVTGPYLGGLMALAITNPVVMPLVNGNWRGVMAVYAGLVLISGLIWMLVSRLREAQLSASEGGRKYNLSPFSEILGVRQVRLVLVMSVGGFL
jgi:cyanate permease